jgi:hypothetical protein
MRTAAQPAKRISCCLFRTLVAHAVSDATSEVPLALSLRIHTLFSQVYTASAKDLLIIAARKNQQLFHGATIDVENAL